MNESIRYKDRTVLIAGAASGFGRNLCHWLARAGATVVALDQDEKYLVELAKPFPNQIEPLPISLSSGANCRLLGEIWGDEPIHALINLMPPLGASQSPCFGPRALVTLARALLPGLEKGRGAVITLNIAADARAPQEQAEEAGYIRLSGVLADIFASQNVRANAILVQDWDEDDMAELREATLFLAAASHLSGSVLRFSSERDA